MFSAVHNNLYQRRWRDLIQIGHSINQNICNMIVQTVSLSSQPQDQMKI
jgi:hypothetical protein